MRSKKSKRMQKLSVLAFATLMLIAFAAGNAFATNGYFSNGYSLESKSMAGAGVALPQGSLDASSNPASMVFVGKRIDVGLSFFNPNRKYTVTGNPSPPPAFGLTPGSVDSDAKWFIIPSFGFNWMIDDKSSVGVSIYGNGGMNTDYDTNTFYGSSPTGVDLIQLFIAPTYARKFAAKHAFGITPIFAYQSFEAKGLQAFSGFSSRPDKLTNNDHDSSYGFGLKVGYLGEILPNLNIGASVQTKILMSKLNSYKGLFAEQGDFDIPATTTVGLAYKVTPELTIALDWQKIYYSDVDAINNPLLPNIMISQLGNDNGAGFGWEDINIIKVGVQWQSCKDWTWRAGYSYGEQPIPGSEILFNILAPGVIKHHATVGLTKTMGNNELKFALMHAFNEKVKGTNPLDPAQQIELKMNQWEISAGYTWKF
ncbi:MAG: outer membrane protein transport protein [Thermodesulfovibrionales bacterium]|nr:outer membrane protein transport protein [Thermodesulfovibrionales bacterium]